VNQLPVALTVHDNLLPAACRLFLEAQSPRNEYHGTRRNCMYERWCLAVNAVRVELESAVGYRLKLERTRVRSGVTMSNFGDLLLHTWQ
jgi:hypothetical protein